MLKKLLSLTILLISITILTGCMLGVRGMYIESYPGTVVEEEPELTLIPGTYVYYYNGEYGDYFFYDGYWWRSMDNTWYRSEIYSGPWSLVGDSYVPYAVLNLPPGWRDFPEYSIRISWGEVHNHWHSWERDRYWDRHGWRRR